MRRSSLRKILKIMSPDNRARVFEANSRACHPRIAIGINEIDLPAEEHVTEIRTPCDENQCTDENDFRQERDPPPHAPFKSANRIPQSEIFIECIRGWSLEVCYVLLSDRGGPVAQRLEQGLIIEERLFAHVFISLHTVADASWGQSRRCAARCVQLHIFHAKLFRP